MDEFISSDVCSLLLSETTIVKANLEVIYHVLPTTIGYLENVILDVIRAQLVDLLYGQKVKSYEIPADNNEGTIWGIDNPKSIEIDVNNAQYYGEVGK